MAGTTFVQAGQDFVVDKLQASTGSGIDLDTPKFIGWGTGTTDPVVGNTGLETPAIHNPTTRTTGTPSQPAADTHRVVGTLTASSTLTISEVGLFTQVGTGSPPTGGTLFIRATFTGIPLLSGDRIEFTIDLVVT